MYFNGKLLPKWSSQWSSVMLPLDFPSCEDDFEKYLDYHRLWRISCSIDHIGVVESEDYRIFLGSALLLLESVMWNKESILHLLEKQFNEGQPGDVYCGVRDGLFEMVKLANRDKRAFWISGSEDDNNTLIEVIKKSQLSISDPNYIIPPHKSKSQLELITKSRAKIVSLKNIMNKIKVEKDVRRQLHNLPTKI